MRRNKIRRSIVVEQTRTVRKLFVEHNIDLTLVEAGRSLYQSLRNAKHRTKTRADYIAKGIKFMFNAVDRFTLLEVILGDSKFWQAWIVQHKIFEKTGLESDRPTIHRLDSDSNYEFGNIAVLPQGEHQQEHAQPVIVLDTDAGKLTTYKSQTDFKEVEGVTDYKVRKMNKAFKADKILSKE